MKPINYTRIAMDDIHPEARRIAVAWMEGWEEWMKSDIAHKVKLASDIMNFAIAYHQHQTEQAGINCPVMRPASAGAVGGELLPAEGSATVVVGGHNPEICGCGEDEYYCPYNPDSPNYARKSSEGQP